MNTRALVLIAKVLAGLSVGFALLLGAGLWLLDSDWFGEWFARELAEELGNELGESVLIGHVEFDLTGRRIEIEGMTISHRAEGEPNDGDLILSMSSLSVSPIWVDGQWAIDELHLTQPFLRLHLDEDGIREFRGLASGPEDGGLTWNEIWVFGATVELVREDQLLRAEGLSLGPGRNAGELDIEALTLEVRRGDASERSEPWQIDGLRWGPGSLGIDSFALSFPSFSIRGSVSVDPSHGLAIDLEGDAALDSSKALLPELASLGGDITWSLDWDGVGDEVVAEGWVWSEQLRFARGGVGETFAVENVEARIGVAERRVDVEVVDLEWAEASWTLRAVRERASEEVVLSAMTESVGVVDFIETARLRLRSRVDGMVALTASTIYVPGEEQQRIEWQLASPELSVFTRPIGQEGTSLILSIPDVSGEGSLEIAEGRFLMEEGVARSPLGELVASMDLMLGEDGYADFGVEMEHIALEQLRPLMGLDLEGRARSTGRLTGSARDGFRYDGVLSVDEFVIEGVQLADSIRGRLGSEDLGVWEFGEIEAHRSRTRFGGQLAVDFRRSARMDLQVLLHEGRISDLCGMVLEVPGLDGDVRGTMSVEGPWNQLTGDVWLDFEDVEILGERFEQGELVAWMDAGQMTLEHLEVSRVEGTESLLARGTIGHGWGVRMELIGSGFRLEYLDHRLPEGLDLRGRLSLDAQVEGTLFRPRPRGRLALWDTTLDGFDVDDTLVHFGTELDLTIPSDLPEDPDIESLLFRGNLGGEGLEIRGGYPLSSTGWWWAAADLDSFPLSRVMPVAADGGPVSGTLDGRVRARGRLGEPQTTVLDAELNRVQVAWAGHVLRNPLPWHYEQSDGHFLLENVGLLGDDTEVYLEASGEVDGQASLGGGGQVDLDWMRSWVDGIRVSEGVVAIGVLGRGDWPRLDLDIELQLDNAQLEGVWFPEGFEGVEGRIRASENLYEFEGLEGRMGGGDVALHGSIDANDWKPAVFDLHGEIEGSRLQMIDFLPPFAGNADLQFQGPSEQALLSGHIEILDMRFNERIDWEGWILEVQDGRLDDASAESWGDYFELEISVSADETIRVRNNLADLIASGELRIIGDTSRIGTVGDIRATAGGRVYLNEREFEIVRAELHFVDPYLYDPEVDVALMTEVTTRDERYQIDYRIGGPYSTWATRASSEPALPEADVHALLLFGMTRAELERYGGLTGALAAEGGDLLASSIVGAGIYQLDIVPSEIRPDRIDLVSSMGSRGIASISSDVRVLAEWDLGWDTTAIFEQNLTRGTDTYVGLETRLARKLYARTYWAGEEYGRNVAVPGAVGLDVNMRWEFD